MINLFYPLIIPAIIISIYYFAFFSAEKIKNYSNFWYSIFISHLILFYMVLFIEISEMSIGSPFNNSTSLVTNIIYYTLSLLQLT
jgi:ABC-type spermidine/putrescine transport system permease subunit II